MTTYNPVRRLSFREKLAEFYWRNQECCDATMFLTVIGLTVVALGVLA